MPKREYDICALVRDMIGSDATVDAGYEREVGKELTGGKDTPHGGVIVPWSVFARDANPMTTVNNAALIPTNTLGEHLIKPLAAKTILAAAGARFIDRLQPGHVKIPKADNVTAVWISAEAADAPTVTPTFAAKTATPHLIAAKIDITRELLVQSCLDVQAVLTNLILESMAREIDAAALAGTGTNGQPLGIVGTEGVNSVTVATPGSATAAEIASFVDTVAAANADDDKVAFVAPSAVRANLRDVRRPAVVATNGVYGGELIMQNGRLFDKPLHVSNVAPAKKLVAGDFSEVAVLTWGKGIEVLFDRYTFSKTGGLRMIAFIETDVIVRNPAAFAVGTVLA